MGPFVRSRGVRDHARGRRRVPQQAKPGYLRPYKQLLPNLHSLGCGLPYLWQLLVVRHCGCAQPHSPRPLLRHHQQSRVSLVLRIFFAQYHFALLWRYLGRQILGGSFWRYSLRGIGIDRSALVGHQLLLPHERRLLPCCVGSFRLRIGRRESFRDPKRLLWHWFDKNQLGTAFGITLAFARIGSAINFVVTPFLGNISVS